MLGERMATEVLPGNTYEQRQERNIDWIPLLIVIGAVYLISTALVYGMTGYGGYYPEDYKLELQIGIVLSFAASTLLIIAVAAVLYSRIEQAKKMLVVGMLVVIVMLAIRTEAYLRGTW